MGFNGQILPGALADTVGIYTATIRDAKGCIKQDSVIVAGNYTLPNATVTVDTIDCITNSGSFHIDTTSAETWLWHGPGGQKQDEILTQLLNRWQLYPGVGRNKWMQNSLLYNLPSDINFPSIEFITQGITCTNPEGQIDIQATYPPTSGGKDGMALPAQVIRLPRR